MYIKKIHEKLNRSTQLMLADYDMNLPYYGHLALCISYFENNRIPTCGVNMTRSGMNFYFNSDFLNRLTQKEVNFVMIHEIFHLIWNHPRRTITGQFEHELSNIAQDMIINHIIWQDITHRYIDIPKNSKGENMALFLPKEYKGELIFEHLYVYLRERREDYRRRKAAYLDMVQKMGEKLSGGSMLPDDGGYGAYGVNPQNQDLTMDTYSLDRIFSDMEDGAGEYLDVHIKDEVSMEARENMVRQSIEQAKAICQRKGIYSDNIEGTLGKLRKKKKDFLSYIKRNVSKSLFGNLKVRSIRRHNRKMIEGIKGNLKIKPRINVIVDTSGSMSGLHEKVFSYIFSNDIECRIFLADTEVKSMTITKSKKDVQNVMLCGGGGTELMPAIDYVSNYYDDAPMLILTDGFTDTLDTSGFKHNILILSTNVSCPIYKTNGKTKTIIIDESYD